MGTRARWVSWHSAMRGLTARVNARRLVAMDRAADDLPALDDQAHVADGREVAGRIAPDRHEVGEQARLDGAPVGQVEDPRVAGRRRDQHLGGGEGPGGTPLDTP